MGSPDVAALGMTGLRIVIAVAAAVAIIGVLWLAYDSGK